jgi:hypothetical protein
MPERDHDDNRWFALLLRRVAIMLICEIEERYDLPRSIVPKDQRRSREMASR